MALLACCVAAEHIEQRQVRAIHSTGPDQARQPIEVGGIVEDVLHGNIGGCAPGVERRRTGLVGNGGCDFAQGNRDGLGPQVADELDLLVRRVEADGFGGHLYQHAGSLLGDQLDHLPIAARVKQMPTIVCTNMSVDGPSTSQLAGPRRRRNFLRGHWQLRMIRLGAAGAGGRDHDLRQDHHGASSSACNTAMRRRSRSAASVGMVRPLASSATPATSISRVLASSFGAPSSAQRASCAGPR